MGIQDGKIQFGHILLDKEIGFEKFKEMYCEYIVEECKGGEGYINLLITPQKVRNDFCVLRIYFHNGKLNMVIVVVRESESFNDWKEYSEKKIKKEKKRLDKLLLKELGLPPYKYRWGEIATSCNARGGTSSIVITYK